MKTNPTSKPSERSSPSCWTVTDGAAGNERQALALAHAMGMTPRNIRLSLRQPWDALAPRFMLGALSAMRDSAGTPIESPWPELVIGCGRRAALLVRGLRQWSGGRCFSVQILDPRIAADHFDVVIAPRHDHVRGDAVIHTLGALNPIDAGWLAQARQDFIQLSRLPGPRTAVLIGASNRAQRLDEAYFHALCQHLARLGGSFMVSASRRTPASQIAWLRTQFASWPGTFWASAEDGPNPYAGLLAWADRIVVTPDSVNMLSEACATGKPVHTLVTHPLRGKLAEFHATLRHAGRVSDITGMDAIAPATPLAETARVAEQVRERWHNARQS